MIDALDKNFEGEEEILHILKSAPKFGNDDDYVDSIVNEVLVHGSNVAAKNKGGVPGALSNCGCRHSYGECATRTNSWSFTGREKSRRAIVRRWHISISRKECEWANRDYEVRSQTRPCKSD